MNRLKVGQLSDDGIARYGRNDMHFILTSWLLKYKICSINTSTEKKKKL